MASERIFGGTQQQTQRSGIEQIIPEPSGHDAQFVSHAQDGDEVNEEPDNPGEESRKREFGKVGHSAVFTYSGH